MKTPALCLFVSPNSGLVYSQAVMARLHGALDFVAPPQSAGTYPTLDEALRNRVEAIITTWGMPRMDDAFLACFPQLKIVFYGAGSVRHFVTAASWARGVRVVNSASSNAEPVAEFSYAQIVLALKGFWHDAPAMRRARQPVRLNPMRPGIAGGCVGLLALGKVGRLVARHLQTFDATVLAYDPYLSSADAQKLGVHPTGLEEIFSRADVVSCHLPLLPETERLLRGEHFRLMKPNSTFLNTARGAVIAEDELIAVLRERPDIQALLDVTHPEPPAPDSLLFELPNVVLSPHTAGSFGAEFHRLGVAIASEVERYVAGLPLQEEITERQILLQA